MILLVFKSRHDRPWHIVDSLRQKHMLGIVQNNMLQHKMRLKKPEQPRLHVFLMKLRRGVTVRNSKCSRNMLFSELTVSFGSSSNASATKVLPMSPSLQVARTYDACRSIE